MFLKALELKLYYLIVSANLCELNSKWKKINFLHVQQGSGESQVGAVHMLCQAKIGCSIKIKVSTRHFDFTKKLWAIQKNWHIYQKNWFFCIIYLLSRTRSTTLTCSQRLIESTIGSLITWITLPSFVSGKTKTALETAEKLVLVFFLLCQDRIHWGRPGLHIVPLHWQVPEEEVQMQVAEYEVQQ